MFEPALFRELAMKERNLRFIAVSGPPVGGKDGIIRLIARKRSSIADTVGEVATVLMNNTKCRPRPTPKDSAVFQSGVFFTQLMFEQLAQHAALAQGKRVVVTNRGAADGPAYVNSRALFEDLVGMSMKEIHDLYYGALFIEMSSRKVFEKYKQRNRIRQEASYEESCQLGDALWKLGWEDHPRVRVVKANDNWHILKRDALCAFDELAAE